MPLERSGSSASTHWPQALVGSLGQINHVAPPRSVSVSAVSEVGTALSIGGTSSGHAQARHPKLKAFSSFTRGISDPA